MTKGYVCVECGSQIVGHSKQECDLGKVAFKFELWWSNTGRYLDPDTDEVSWFDKRKELAALAYAADRESDSANGLLDIIQANLKGDLETLSKEQMLHLLKTCRILAGGTGN